MPAHRGTSSTVTVTTVPAGSWPALAVVVAAQFMFVVDAFIVNVAIPSIRADLHASPGEIGAVIAAYQITYAATVITGGRLGDIVGRRLMFIAGVLAFTAASLWCGLAGSGGELVLARMAQGATAAMMVPQVLATIHTLFPGAGRARAFAVFGIALGLGGATGFAVGGWLVTLDPFGLGWRSVFLVNLPLGIVIALAGLCVMPRAAGRPGLRLDLPGAAVLFLALAGLTGPVMAGHELGWPWWLWAATAGGGAALALFARLERRVERRGGQPLIDLGLLADRAFLRGLGAAFSFQFGNISFYLVAMLFIQGELGFTPLRAGLVVVPMALSFTLASQLAGRWMGQIGLRMLAYGTALQFAGIVALGVVAASMHAPGFEVLAAALTIFGFGQGLVMAPLTGVVLATVQPSNAGSAAGLLNTVQQSAGAVGVSLVGTAYFLGGAADRHGVLAAILVLAVSVLATARLLGRMRHQEPTR